jgi:hypothetical protein
VKRQLNAVVGVSRSLLPVAGVFHFSKKQITDSLEGSLDSDARKIRASARIQEPGFFLPTNHCSSWSLLRQKAFDGNPVHKAQHFLRALACSVRFRVLSLGFEVLTDAEFQGIVFAERLPVSYECARIRLM